MLSRKFMVTMAFVSLLCLTAWGAVSAATSFTFEYDMSQDDTRKVEFVSPTVTGSGVKGFNLTRGPGINPANLIHGYSADGWNGAVTLADAITQGKYYQWGFTTEAVVSLQTMDVYLRRSGVSSPMNMEIHVSFDGFATPGFVVSRFNYYGRRAGTAPAVDPTLTDPFYYMHSQLSGRPDTETSLGDAIPTIDLTQFPQLQGIPDGVEVTFRLYAWGNEATTPSNSFALGRMSGPKITGIVGR
ncbi:MAG TPA: hypothetical protein GXZ82_01055 [Firmicutes bacterium]|jgi:hypothetical protein|nr:hypothetical protein [Bacillota bacterium]